MKLKFISLLIVFGFAGQSWGQNTIGQKGSEQVKIKKFITGKTNRGVDSTRTKTYEIDYDFVTGKFNRNRNKLEVNTPVIFKVSNINRFAYKTNISLRDSILASSFIDEFVILAKNFKETDPGKTKVNEDAKILTSNESTDIKFVNDDIADKIEKSKKGDIVLQVNNIPKLQSLIQLLGVRKDSIKNKEAEIKILQQSYKLKKIEIEKKLTDNNPKIEATGINLSSIKNREEKTEQEKEKITTELAILDESSMKDILKINETIKNIAARITQDDSEIKKLETAKLFALQKFEIDSKKFIESYNEVEGIYKQMLRLRDYYKKVINISRNPELTKEFYQREYKENLRAISLELKISPIDLSDYEAKYQDLQKYYDYMKYNPELNDVLDYGGKTKLYTYVEKLKTLANQMNENIKANDYDEITKHIQQAIPLLENPETYYEVSYPVQPMNDVVVFDIDIKKHNNARGDLDKSKRFKYREFTYGGTRFDLGVGLAGSWFPNVKTYEMQQEKDSTRILQQAKQTYSPAFVGMFTTSYRNTRYTTFGFSIGMGVNLEDDKIQLDSFYIGPSIILGKYDRITITTGVTMKKVNILKQGYEIGSAYISKDNGKDFYTREYRAGAFLSLTYNLTKGVRDNIKYMKNLAF